MSIIYFNRSDEAFYVSEWGHTYLEAGKNVGPYSFNDHLLHFNLRGRTEYLGKTSLEGQAFFIPKKTKYSFKALPGYDHYWFAFSGYKADSFLKVFGIDSEKGCILDVGHREHFSKYMAETFELCRNTNSEQLAMTALFSLLSLCKKEVPDREKTEDVEFAASVVENNYYKELRISDIAAAVRLEQKYFSRKFKNRFGMSPVEYLTDIRIRKGCELLRNEEYMIKEIAFLCGYNSSLAFNVAFRKKMGMSPQSYRDSRQ